MERSVNDILKDVYLGPSSPAQYAGINAVLKEAKRHRSSITQQNVKDYLATVDGYTLHKPVRRRFHRNETRSPGIDAKWQADLIDFQKLKTRNRGYAYVLVCIDVLSRYAFCESVKRKTPDLVAEAFKRIIKKGRMPWILYTDKGGEFGKTFQDMLKKNDIHHVYATSPDVKCSLAERFIRTFKMRLWRHFTNNETKKWTDMVQPLTDSINRSHHRILGQTPESVTVKNQTKVWNHLYGRRSATKPRYKPGDMVLITREKGPLAKGYEANFASTIYVIDKVLDKRQPVAYKLEDLEGIFYDAELSRILA